MMVALLQGVVIPKVLKMNPSIKLRFRILDLLFTTALVGTALGWYVDHVRLRDLQTAERSALKAMHKYEVTVEGTPGVELALTLVKRPVEKHTQIISLPFSMNFDANRAAVWIEDFPDGKSGNDGDTYTLTMKKDGIRIPRSMSGSIQKDKTGRQYNGRHQLVLSDWES